jgi:hypothetical protein
LEYFQFMVTHSLEVDSGIYLKLSLTTGLIRHRIYKARYQPPSWAGIPARMSTKKHVGVYVRVHLHAWKGLRGLTRVMTLATGSH